MLHAGQGFSQSRLVMGDPGFPGDGPSGQQVRDNKHFCRDMPQPPFFLDIGGAANFIKINYIKLLCYYRCFPGILAAFLRYLDNQGRRRWIRPNTEKEILI